MQPGQNFWTGRNKPKFHQSINRLSAVTSHPQGSPKGYRRNTGDESSLYVLNRREELETADYLAFLAPPQEGVKTITALALEEHQDGQLLVIRIASNETPPANMIQSFACLLDVVMRYAQTGRYPTRGNKQVD